MIGMPLTTIDIKDLKRAKREALDRGITVKELVNLAIKEYLDKPRKPQGQSGKSK